MTSHRDSCVTVKIIQDLQTVNSSVGLEFEEEIVGRLLACDNDLSGDRCPTPPIKSHAKPNCGNFIFDLAPISLTRKLHVR